MSFKDHNIITKLISQYNLNLAGQVILTEIGTDEYTYLPEICLEAGAKYVIALVKDSAFGKASTIIKAYKKTKFYEGNKNQIEIIKDLKKCSETLNQVTIVTNSGHLRPINKSILSLVAKNCHIALMYDIWEFRDRDINLEDCKNLKIPIIGTYEHHKELKIFDYSGVLAVKMMLNSGNSIKNQSVLIWSDDDFGKSAFQYIKKLDPKKCHIKCKESTLKNADHYDVIFICDYDEERIYGEELLKEFFDLNKGISVVHLFGKISKTILNVFPERNSYSKKMSKTFSYLGLMPILELQIASLKATSSVMNNEYCSYAQIVQQ